MAEWAYVENKEIKELHDLLPKNWRNVSGLYLSANDPAALKQLGWFRVIKKHKSYNSETHKEIGYEHKVTREGVVETLKIVEKSPDELPDPAKIREDFLNSLRSERDRRLQECDWTQLSDVRESMTDEERESWSLYRRQLRDVTIKYSYCEDYRNLQVDWPEQPK